MINVKENFELIFHADGGITLQTDNYCHYYPEWLTRKRYYTDTDTVAKRVAELLGGGTAEGWEDNEPDKRIVNIISEDDCYDQNEIIRIISEQDKAVRSHIVENLIDYAAFDVFKNIWRIMDKK